MALRGDVLGSGRSTVRNNSMTFNGVNRRALLPGNADPLRGGGPEQSWRILVSDGSSGPLPGRVGGSFCRRTLSNRRLSGAGRLNAPFFAESVNFLVADVNRAAVHCQHGLAAARDFSSSHYRPATLPSLPRQRRECRAATAWNSWFPLHRRWRGVLRWYQPFLGHGPGERVNGGKLRWRGGTAYP